MVQREDQRTEIARAEPGTTPSAAVSAMCGETVGVNLGAILLLSASAGRGATVCTPSDRAPH